MQLLVKWYGARNAPGPQDFSPVQEWDLFLVVLFTLLGYDVEKLHLIRNNEKDQSMERSSPMVLAKKQKTSNCGSADDWQYILNSNEHKSSQTFVSSVLKTQKISSSFSIESENIAESSGIGKINTQAILFSHLPLVLFSLHLLYEELKLNSVASESLPLLGKLLYQLSIDLKFEIYSHHYFLDSPSLFYLKTATSQISDMDLQRITIPNYVSRKPPDIFEMLDNILNNMDVSPFPYLGHVNLRTRNIIYLTVLIANENRVNTVEMEKYVKLITPAGSSRVDPQENGSKSDKEIFKKLEKPTMDRIILLYHEMGKLTRKLLEDYVA
jgi:anaphase-promoting complex subunit 1